MILSEHGYRCEQGVLYYAVSRERVSVPFDEELRRTTHNAIDGLRLIADGGQIPPPLEGSPKCPRCSLVGICLPDEINFFRKSDRSRSRPSTTVMVRPTDFVQAAGSVNLTSDGRKRFIGAMIHPSEDHVILLNLGVADKVVPRIVSLGKSDFTPIEHESVIV